MTNTENNNLLIADSGSTKTDWALISPQGDESVFVTSGINPYLMADEQIAGIVTHEVLPEIGGRKVRKMFFYGAGCREEQCARMQRIFGQILQVEHVEVNSDLLGAARSLCGNEAGMACILGTGSNSGLYDGARIIKNTPPLGFILGDEGSGAALGCRLVGSILKGLMPNDICKAFFKEYDENAVSIMQKVYGKEKTNRYLASFAPFISKHRHIPAIRSLVVTEFSHFFHRNLSPYQSPDLPANFVGSIAYHLHEELKEAATCCGIKVGRIVKAPMEGLIEYHKSRDTKL